MSETLDIVLVRHGPTLWNVAARFQGQTNTPLSQEAIDVLTNCRLPLRFSDYDMVSSPLQRAVHTAQALDVRNAVLEPRLMEMHYGQWQGKTRSEIGALLGNKMQEMESLGIDFRPAGGESPRELRTRVQSWLVDVAQRSRPVVGFTHKGVIHMALAIATGWDLKSKRPYKLDWRSVHCFSLDQETLCLSVNEVNIPLRSGVGGG